MTYFGFLAQFLVIPILLLALLTWLDWRRGLTLPPALRGWPAWRVVVGHIIVALVYTTPWDNYLVATGVWSYNPALITGLVLGWVPLEEYTFFVLQPLLTSLWLLFLARRLPVDPRPLPRLAAARWLLLSGLGLLWLGMAAVLAVGWSPGVYLALILLWALPPVMLQIGFGADILWRHRRLVLWTLLPVTLYLSLADALAIGSGTWTIDPAQSLQIFLGGVLPVEEFIFFLMTNILLVLGTVLVLAHESQSRVSPQLRARLAHLSGLGLSESDSIR
ncbi:MAG: lycopene cyclase domain-containing protein [Anaerolineae bacterium]|nr:lycopene cyclase domain-containing protein [Anaerolineales bacterium]MCQ3978853.1 lycopene cyclase domain-containing protein [Anaerolineae bacterium]